MPLNIGGIEPFTTIDFPKRLAAVLFCLGCPLRCPYCHNPELQNFNAKSFVSWETFLEFLDARKGLLDGIVFSGGEPLCQPELYNSMEIVKKRGFEIGLHTSGVHLARLKEVIPLLDWVGFDVKAPFDVYEQRIPNAQSKVIEACLDALIKADIDLEARTTLDPRVIKKDELLGLAKTLSEKGVKAYALQQYHPFPEENNPPSFSETTAFFEDKALLEEIESLFETLIIRKA